MNEEIKEILEYLKKSTDSKDFCGMIITKNNLDKILDYVTNLQKENKHLSKSYADSILFNQKRCEQNKELQKENEELSQDNLEGCKKFMKYKQRIDKAIEYIEDNTYEAYGTNYMDLTGIKELKKILGGDE